MCPTPTVETPPVNRLHAQHRARMAARRAAPVEPVDRAGDFFTVARPGDTRCPGCGGPMRAGRELCSFACHHRATATSA